MPDSSETGVQLQQRESLGSMLIQQGIVRFFGMLLVLAVVRITLGFVSAPVGLLLPINVLLTIVFLGTPIVALYQAASARWSPILALVFVVGGVSVQAGFVALANLAFRGDGLAAALAFSLSQVGLISWCVGLGALLTTLLKDKNLLIPVSIFLACFDVFLVLTPVGFTKQIMEKAPNLLPSVAIQVPKIQAAATHGRVGTFANVGPADFLFMGMFFVAMFRFKLRPKATVQWLIPTMMFYLLFALLVGPIPLLVPIGLCVLIVNIREFKLNKEEWLSTALVSVIMVGLVTWGLTRPRVPAEPSKPVASQGARGPADSPKPTPGGPRR